MTTTTTTTTTTMMMMMRMMMRMRMRVMMSMMMVMMMMIMMKTTFFIVTSWFKPQAFFGFVGSVAVGTMHKRGGYVKEDFRAGNYRACLPVGICAEKGRKSKAFPTRSEA
eukprot:1797779-Karenia_brevis.AAC.1